MVGIAYALFSTAEFGIWLVLLVIAYEHGGPTASMTMVLVQLVPCIVIGPFIGSFADRRRPSRVLCAGYGLQALSMAGVAAAVGFGAPLLAIYLLAPLTALSLTVTRPAQAALLPAIVRTPDELTAANVMTGWTEGAASLAGPAVAGVLLTLSGPGLAVAGMAAMSGVSTLLVAGVDGPAAAVSTDDGGSAGADPSRPGGPASVGTGVRSNLAATARNPQVLVLLILHSFYYVLIGSLDLLCVILALTVLHLGQGGAGYLNAALGAGALLAGLVTAFLVGRRHLSHTLTLSLATAVAALALIAGVTQVAVVFVLIATVGLAGTVFDITGRTLLQRAAPPDAIAGSFAIFESMTDFGLATGAVLVRVAIGVGGVRAALLAPAVLAVVLIAALWRQLSRIDASATIPQVEIQLLRSLPIFAALGPPSLEGVARELATGAGAGRDGRDHRRGAGQPVLRGGRRPVRHHPGRAVGRDGRPGRRVRRDRSRPQRAPSGNRDRGHRRLGLLPRQGPFRPDPVRPRLRRVGGGGSGRPASGRRAADRRRGAGR